MGLVNSRFIRNRDVVSRQIEGELIIVPVRRGVGDMNSLYTLNPVGSVLWEFMAQEHSRFDARRKTDSAGRIAPRGNWPPPGPGKVVVGFWSAL